MGLPLGASRWLPLLLRRRPFSTANSVDNLLRDSASFEEKNKRGEWASPPYPRNTDPKQDPAYLSFRPAVDPRETSVFLFPGQGSQFVGMGKKLLGFPSVRELYEAAGAILNWDLLKLCLEGPVQELNRTVHCQCALFVTSLAAVERLRDETPLAVERCIAAAGFSVGEYAALVFAGSLSFDAGLRLVKARAEAMQEVSESEPSSMMTVMTRADSRLPLAMKGAVQWMKSRGHANPVCEVANYLFPECKVIAGHSPAVAFVRDNAKEFRLGPTKLLPVSGAFHTRIMEPAALRLEELMRRTEFREPLISVHSNLDARTYKHPDEIRRKLLKQIFRPVRWEQVLHSLYDRNPEDAFPASYEVGSGRQLTSILNKLNSKAAQFCRPVEV